MKWFSHSFTRQTWGKAGPAHLGAAVLTPQGLQSVGDLPQRHSQPVACSFPSPGSRLLLDGERGVGGC